MMGAEMSYGLTATPFRTDRVHLSFEKIISDYGVRFLIEHGYLSPFNQYVIQKFTPESVANLYIGDQQRWGKSIMYFKNQDLCDEAHERLKAAGVKSATIYGNHSQSYRDTVFGEFEDNKTQVLINVYLLTEGFDSQDLQSVFVRDSGKLTSMQMVGRCLRKDPNNPNKVANVIQSEGTWFPYTRVTRAKTEYILRDGQWQSIEPSEKVNEVSNEVRDTLSTIVVSLPSFLNGEGSSLVVGANGQVTVKPRTKKKRQFEF
jgi:superfamily II DNA or RNA helicase